MHHCAESIFKVDYISEYEFIFKTALAHESGDTGVLFDEKDQRSKISWDCAFKAGVTGIAQTWFSSFSNQLSMQM
jgi:hypothetical protein